MSLGDSSKRPPDGRAPTRRAAQERDLRRLFALDALDTTRTGLDPAAPASARVLASLASLCLGAVLPVLMVVANKSAPAVLGAAALFATLAVLLARQGGVLKARYRALMTSPAVAVATAIVLLAILSLWWSIDRAITLRGLVEGIPELAFALALAAAWPLVASPRHVHWLLIGLVGAAILILFERFAGMPLHTLIHERGEAWDLKRSAIPPALLVWPAIGFCLHRGQKWAAAALFLTTVVGVVAAHSGAPGFALAAAVLLFFAAVFAPRAAVTVVAVVLAILVVLSAWTGTLATRFLPPPVESALSEQHAAHRIQIWTAFEARVRDRPLLGHGFDTSFKVAGAPRPGGRPPEADNGFMVDNHPHNIFLQFWVEFGLLGGVAAAAVSAFALQRLDAAQRRTLPPRLALLVTVVGIGLVGLSAWQPWWIASIAAALLWFDLLKARTGA